MTEQEKTYESLREEVDENHPLYELIFESWAWMTQQQKGYLADTIWREREFDLDTFWEIGTGMRWLNEMGSNTRRI